MKQPIQVAVNLNPSEEELMELEPLWNAVDMMIIMDAFSGNNPMRQNNSESKNLFWNWAIVSVGKLKFPTPIHPCSTDAQKSILYTYSGRAIMLSNEECAMTTAYFYIDHLLILGSMKQAAIFNAPLIANALTPGISQLEGIDVENFHDIRYALKSNLGIGGHDVLA